MTVFPEEDSLKNYPSDYADGHNKYICNCAVCDNLFYGYKRRLVCKECYIEDNNPEKPLKPTSPIKPLKPKPQFYALCFGALQEISRIKGYNLVLHGSLDRDMDLIAIPWVDSPRPEIELIRAFDMHLRGVEYEDAAAELGYHFSTLPGGRHSYVIHLNRGGYWNGYVDEQYYLDISVTPLCLKPHLKLYF